MSDPRILLVLSFDHELHLGGARSYETNMFEPSDRVLDLANELRVPICLFTDVLCAIRFREWGKQEFSIPYERQIHRALREGHEVQLHIHPHWADSKFEGGTFVPSRSFALHDFRDARSPNDIRGLVFAGRDFLVDLCGQVASSYKCIAYRAGGYNLAPSTEAILSALYEAGIRIDSSIAKGYTFSSSLSSVSYNDMPAEANWFIDPQGPLDRPAESGILEVPIGSSPLNPINNVPYRLRKIVFRSKIRTRVCDSGGWMIHEGHYSRLRKMRELFLPQTAHMLGFDNHNLSARDVLGILHHHVRRHSAEKEIILSAISHPKVMGPYHLSLMREFVAGARARYGDALEFVTFRDVYETRLAARKRTADLS